MLFLSILFLSAACQASPAHNLGRWEPGWSRGIHHHHNYQHHHRSPGLSFSLVSSGSAIPNPFTSLLNMKASSPPHLQPLNLPHPFFSKLPWSNVQDNHQKLPGHWLDGPTEDVKSPLDSLIGNIFRPFSQVGSMITSSLQEMNKDLLPKKDSINIESPSLTNFDENIGDVFSSIFGGNVNQKEEETKNQEEETLADIFNKIFGVQVHLIPVRQQFVTEEDIEEALVTGDDNIMDAIKEEDVDLDEIFNEEEDIPDSVNSDKFFETLNAIINPKFTKEDDILASTQNNNFYETLNGIFTRPKKQDVVEEVEQDVSEEVEQDVVEEAEQDVVEEAEQDVVEQAKQGVVEEVQQADMKEVQQVVIEKVEQDVVEQAEQDVLEEAKQDVVQETEQMDFEIELIDGNIITNEV